MIEPIQAVPSPWSPAGAATLEQKIAIVLPTPAEEQWLQIPWEPNLMRARRISYQSGKPLFLWIMDGNVLGCTCNSGQLSRQLVLSHPEIIQRLQTAFVPVSAGTEKLQWGTSEAARWFKGMAQHAIASQDLAEWWQRYQNYQGIYLAGPDGTNYGVIREWDVAKTIQALDAALAQHRARALAALAIAQEAVERASPSAPDPTTSVVRVLDCTQSTGPRMTGAPPPRCKGFRTLLVADSRGSSEAASDCTRRR
jgi:hypothetical protein